MFFSFEQKERLKESCVPRAEYSEICITKAKDMCNLLEGMLEKDSLARHCEYL